jgi:uncharacterized protein with GYD domain
MTDGERQRLGRELKHLNTDTSRLKLAPMGLPPPGILFSEESTLAYRKEVMKAMGTYVMLSRLSTEGVKTVKQNPDRIKAVDKEVEALGARVISQYALLGAYDFLTVLEAPDPETVSRVSVELGMRGSGKFETFAAIPIDDFIASIKKK